MATTNFFAFVSSCFVIASFWSVSALDTFKISTAAGNGKLFACCEDSKNHATNTTLNSPVLGIWGSSDKIYLSDSKNYQIKVANFNSDNIYNAWGNGTIGNSTGLLSFVHGLWGIGTYLYAADGGNGAVKSLDFASGDFETIVDGLSTPMGIWGNNDNSALYITDFDGIILLLLSCVSYLL